MIFFDHIWRDLLLYGTCGCDKGALGDLQRALRKVCQTRDFEQLTNGALISFCMVSRAASWHSELISAPLQPSVWMQRYALLRCNRTVLTMAAIA
jgi:hypothetical protein